MTVDKFFLLMPHNLKSLLQGLGAGGERLSKKKNKVLTKITSPVKVISARER